MSITLQMHCPRRACSICTAALASSWYEDKFCSKILLQSSPAFKLVDKLVLPNMLAKVPGFSVTPTQSSNSIMGNETDPLKDCSLLKSLNFSDAYIADYLDFFAKLLKNDGKDTNTGANENVKACYCNGTMQDIAVAYSSVHDYVSLFVCIFGTLANSINIAVLTRREMKTAPFAYILTWLAVTDMMLMIEYIPFASLYTNMDSESNMARFSYPGAIFILIHTHLSQVLHNMSICLTLTLAFWRYNAIRYPEKCSTLWTNEKCANVVKIAMVLPLIICIPSLFMYEIRSQIVVGETECYYVYRIDVSEVAKSHQELLYIVNLWLYAVVIKLLPCIILIVISLALIKALRDTTKRKEKLQNNVTNHGTKNIKLQKSKKRADRSSHMLIAILFLFLLTEFPQCILGILSGINGSCFFKDCYHLFGEIMDILALLNGAINFVLYCTMSKQFRLAFVKLFRYVHIVNDDICTRTTDNEFQI